MTSNVEMPESQTDNINERSKPNLQEIRIYQVLDKMDNRLHGMEQAMLNFVRVDEKVINHTAIIKDLTQRIEDHENRIRNSEILQRDQRNYQGGNYKGLNNLNSEVNGIKKDVNSIKLKLSKDTGKKSTIGVIIAWFMTILATVLAFKITNPK